MAKKKAKSSKSASTKKTDSQPVSSKQREDGMMNALTGLGVAGKDKRLGTRVKAQGAIPVTMLNDLYRGNGITRRICELPPKEMTRNWFRVSGDEDDKVLQKLEVLEAQEAYTDAMVWARLFGGAVILMGINDGRDIEEPVAETAIKAINYLSVFDRGDVQIDHNSISEDPTDPLFGKPAIYEITPMRGGTPFKVHASRLIRFDGAKVTNETLRSNYNDGWHDSIIQATYEQIRSIGGVFDSAEFIVEDFIQTIIKINNLANLIAAGQDDQVKKRLELIDLSRHVANTLLIDGNEDYAKHSSTVTGLDEILDRFMMNLSSVTGIPVTLLMGRSPAGMNATGDADIRMFYDSIRSMQRSYLRPRLERLIRYCFIVSGGEPDAWSVEFNPLWEMTEAEKADVYKTNAEGDQVYISNGVTPPEAIEKHRFGGADYNSDQPIYDVEEEFESDNEPTPEEMAARQAEAEAAAAAAAGEE